MSRQIPEIIVPGSLFVPTLNDQFSIVAGGMPNGDDCLRVDGAADTNHSAWQDANLGVNTVNGPINSSGGNKILAFWFRVISGLSAFSSYPSGVGQAVNPPMPNCLWSHSCDRNTTASADVVWAFLLHSDRVSLVGRSSVRYADGNWGDGTWHFVIAETQGVGSPISLYVDGTPYTATTSISANGASFNGNGRVGIGNVQPDAGNTSRRGVDGIVDIGKLAVLETPMPSNFERQALFDAMMSAA